MRPSRLLPLLLAPLALACAATDARLPSVERAHFLEARGQWLEAGETWQRLHTADRSDGEAARGLARALEAQGNPAGALAVLSGAREDAPGDAALREELGARFLALGRLEEALMEFRAAAAADPGWATPRRAVGDLGLRLGEVSEARGALEEAVRIEPGDARTWILLARARELDEDPVGSLDAWTAADERRELTPNDALRAGRLALEHDDWRVPAERWVSRARARAPHRSDVLLLHSELLQSIGREDESVAALARALEIEPGDLAVLEELARARARRGELAELQVLIEHARAVEGGSFAEGLEALAEEAEAEAARAEEEADPEAGEASGSGG